MNTVVSFPAALAVCVLMGGCNIAGPAAPEKNGRVNLERRGCAPELIARLIDGEALTPAEVAEFQSSGSADVRFLVARHPGVSGEQLDVSIASRDDFTRSGAARNRNLSAGQIERLTADASHTVYAGLAGNPALSDEELMRIRETRQPGDLWFALNPNCPEPVRKAIGASDDALAKHWLKTVDGWKRDGRYGKDRAGRWCEKFEVRSEK